MTPFGKLSSGGRLAGDLVILIGQYHQPLTFLAAFTFLFFYFYVCVSGGERLSGLGRDRTPLVDRWV